MKPIQPMEIKDKNEISGDEKSQVYEVGYLLVPTIADTDVPAVYGNLKELILSLGGEIIADEMPKMMNLAYSMLKVVTNIRHKFSTAYFGWTKFTMDTEKVLELKKRLDLDINLIRFLILKTVKENTIAAKRFVRGDSVYRRPIKRSSDEPVAPINKEEVDKEIDALIAI